MAYNIATKAGVQQHLGRNLFEASKPYFNIMEEGSFFCDDGPVSSTKIHIVKISKDNFTKIKPLLRKDKVKEVMRGGKNSADVDFVYGKLRFLETGKISVSASDGESTAKQERASLLIIERALKENKVYGTPKDIAKDKVFFKKLIEAYPEINDTWLKGLHAQAAKMKSLYGGTRFTEYNRDGGFMDYISNLVKVKFGISKKDSWCPADIWLIKDETAVRKAINESVAGKVPSMSKLNDTMRRLYDKKQLVGVSLKAISGATARWENVNTESTFSDADKFKLTGLKITMSLKPDKTLSTTDTVITVEAAPGRGAKFQLRQNSKGFNNLKFEPTKIGAGAARLGKVPLDMLARLLPEYGITTKDFVNNWRMYPQTAAEFKEQSAQYLAKFKKINADAKVTTGIKDSEFVNNMTASFKSDDKDNGVSTSKLQQIDFVHAIIGLKATDRNNLLTDMLYLAEKKGTQFGPFGKLY